MLMDAVTGPDRRLLRPIYDALNEAVTMAVCSWIVNGARLGELGEVVSAIHGDMHQVMCAHSGELLTLAGMAEARLRTAGNHQAADFISVRIQSVARALVHEPSATGTEQ
jgi:hypothetical protein